MSAFASLKTVAAYSPQARALFARLATQPAPARAAAYDAVIRALLAAGVWSKLDALYLLAAADAATALTNLKQSSYGLTAVNSPAFTADRGYTGNGTTQYLNPGFTPSTAGGKLVQNSASIFWWTCTRNAVVRGTLLGLTVRAQTSLCIWSIQALGSGLTAPAPPIFPADQLHPKPGCGRRFARARTRLAGYYNGVVEVSSGARVVRFAGRSDDCAG